jgi:hypothetical protein
LLIKLKPKYRRDSVKAWIVNKMPLYSLFKLWPHLRPLNLDNLMIANRICNRLDRLPGIWLKR